MIRKVQGTAGEDLYTIHGYVETLECPLVMGGPYGSWRFNNAEIRCGESASDKFWIRHGRIGTSNCPLYWSGAGPKNGPNIKNAEFRCGNDKTGDRMQLIGFSK